MISAKSEYACLAMLELAVRFSSGEPVRIREIAEIHGIPSQFLVQILLQLKNAGLVTSVRGASGGYRLARHPSHITLCDVLSAVDGRFANSSLPASDRSSTAVALAEVWQNLQCIQRDALSQINLEELRIRVGQDADVGMYYI